MCLVIYELCLQNLIYELCHQILIFMYVKGTCRRSRSILISCRISYVTKQSGDIWIVPSNPHLWSVLSNPHFFGIIIHISWHIWTKWINMHFILYFICHDTTPPPGVSSNIWIAPTIPHLWIVPTNLLISFI